MRRILICTILVFGLTSCLKSNKGITIEQIDSTPDEDLVYFIFKDLSNKVGSNYDDEYQIVSKFTKEQQAIYSIWAVEGEVNNGGFNQYFYNTDGIFADMALQGFQQIGAKKFSDLLSDAIILYQTEMEKISEKQDGTIEGFSESYENNPLNKLDEEFYETYDQENIYELQVKFIREHKDQFANK